MAKFTIFARPDHDIMSIFIYPVEGETVDEAKADAQNQIEKQWELQPSEYEIIGVLGVHAEAPVQDERVEKALEIARRYGGIDGAHHKEWVIDQMVRALTEDDYEDWVAEAKSGEDGPNTYGWEEGIAP